MIARENPNIDITDVPSVVREIAAGRAIKLVWRNELGGLTFRVGEHFIKWNPINEVDLSRERDRLIWLADRHPAPIVHDFGADADAQWLVTAALDGEHAVGDRWRSRRSEAIRTIAEGLRRLHSLPLDDVPSTWESWANRTPKQLGSRPDVDDPVLVHGDACAPNTLISEAGVFVGHVDLGDLTVADRWADLAVASLSLDWNFGEGHQPEFFDAYGIEPDQDRIAYYRALWDAES